MTLTHGAQSANAEPTDPAPGSPAAPGHPQPDAAVLRSASDVELLRLVRAGFDTAFAELFARHATAVRGFAVRCCTDVSEAEDLAAEAFFRVLQAVRRGAGPDDNIRAYLSTVVRRLAAEWSVRRRDVPVTDEELSRQVDAGYAAPASRADLQLISRAFASLPARWRAVLWRVEVEGERPAVVARYFGLSANATAALARRARQGLRAAYLQAHVAPNGGANGCRSIVDKLGGFTAGQVTGAEARRIRTHLGGCADCAALQAELADVCAGLRRYAGSLTAPAAGLALGAHHGLGVLLAKLAGRIAGHAAALGARFKLVVAAVSMAAVGGFGVAAGPILAHLHDTTIDADRGDGLQQLLHSVPGTSSHSTTTTTTAHTGARRFDQTMRSEVRGPSLHPQPHIPADPAMTTTAVAPTTAPATSAAAQQQTGSPTTAGTSAGTKPMQAQAASQPVATTTDPVGLTTTPAASLRAAGTSSTATRPPKATVWSTSWTSNGTTVYETIWYWSDTVR